MDIPETAWKKLVERDHSFVRGTLPRWRGREQDTVLVSQTVKDLVAGCGLEFEGRGEHEPKGVPDRWRLYRVVSERA